MNSKGTRIILLLVFAHFLNIPLHSQSAKSAGYQEDSLLVLIREKTGTDQELINGKQYFNAWFRYPGHPFFPDDSFHPGSLFMGSGHYPDLSLKYDCHSQELILEYTDNAGRYNHLVINKSRIDSFDLGDLHFVKLELDGKRPQFYQVVTAGRISCFVNWKKDLVPENFDREHLYRFGEPAGSFYLRYGDSITPFSSKRTFISCFPAPMQKSIRKYLGQEHIIFREMDHVTLETILEFISGLDGNTVKL